VQHLGGGTADMQTPCVVVVGGRRLNGGFGGAGNSPAHFHLSSCPLQGSQLMQTHIDCISGRHEHRLHICAVSPAPWPAGQPHHQGCQHAFWQMRSGKCSRARWAWQVVGRPGLHPGPAIVQWWSHQQLVSSAQARARGQARAQVRVQTQAEGKRCGN
jgi:hypothetical protein